MIKRKLSEDSGASILIALIFFMICAVVGTLMITASMASSGRMHNLKSDQQSYYNIYSAAKLLEKELCDQKYSKYKEVSESGEESMEYLEKPNSSFSDLLVNCADHIFEKHTEIEKTLYVSLPSSTDKEEMEVEAKFFMDTDYQIVISLYEKSNPSIEYEVRIPAILSQSNAQTIVIKDDKEVTRYITSLSWGKAEIAKK